MSPFPPHENGHRQQLHSLAGEGGWGPQCAYDRADDQRDLDYVNDVFEATEAAQQFGFSVLQDDKERIVTWEHAPIWDAATGKGKCKRNEQEVENKQREIEKDDWSDLAWQKQHK